MSLSQGPVNWTQYFPMKPKYYLRMKTLEYILYLIGFYNATYLNTIGQSHMSPHCCQASWHTTQAAVFSILICCVAAQCNWTEAAKSTCSTWMHIVNVGKKKLSVPQWKWSFLNCTHRQAGHCSRSTGPCSIHLFGRLSHSRLHLVVGTPLGLTFRIIWTCWLILIQLPLVKDTLSC